MGIEQFFKKMRTCSLTQDAIQEINGNIKLMFESIYFDFNSIIHNTSAKLISNANKSIEKTIVEKQDSFIFKEIIMSDLENAIINEVLDHVLKMLTVCSVSDQVKNIYLCMDGVPSLAKMQEQKKRRLFGSLMFKFRKDLLLKWKNQMKKKTPSKYIYEELKIEWNKCNIGPGTVFMHLLNKKLTSDDYKEKLKEIFPNLKKYVVLSTDEHGEGEKKIMDIINSSDYEKQVLIYSPDADVELLSMICKNENVYILKEENTGELNLINVKKLKTYILQIINDDCKENINRRMINDIVLLSTVFGNDFLPKMKSVNVKNDFEYLLKTYSEYFKQNKNYIMTDTFEIDTNNLIKMLELLSKNENDRIYYNFMNRKYHNFKHIIDIISPCAIRGNPKCPQQSDPNRTLSFKNFVDIINGIKKLWNQLINSSNPNNISLNSDIGKYLLKLCGSNPIEEFNKYGKINSKCDVYLRSRRKYSPNINYDDELNKFESMDGVYSEKLINKYNYLVHVKKDEWIIKPLRPTDPNIIKEFIIGLKWLVKYYFTSWNNINSIWYYKYENCPTITELCTFLKNNPNFYKNINLNQYEKQKLLTPYEHMLYVTPLTQDNLFLFTSSDTLNYGKFDSKLAQLSKLLVKDEYSLEESILLNKKINCNDALYTNKCIINI